jgi:anti-sigma regulatory factor (Ser/Thr protein kinase)
MQVNDTSTMRKEGLLLPGTEQSVGVARQWLRDVLKEDPRLFDCMVCVAELMTNALRYTDSGKGGWILVMVWVGMERVRVEVTDDGGALSVPRMRDPDAAEARGRGLQIVDALSAERGVERVNPGHAVWFTLEH